MCRKRQWKCQAGKGWIFLGSWRKTKGLGLDLFPSCQGVWPLPLFIHSYPFHSFHLSFPSLYFLSGRRGQWRWQCPSKRGQPSQKKISQGRELPTPLPSPPLYKPMMSWITGPAIFSLWFQCANSQECQSLDNILNYFFFIFTWTVFFFLPI